MLQFRPLVRTDQAALWHWLHIALWDPPPAPLRPLAVLDNPGVRIYVEDWGKATDIGVVAVVDGQAAGACWMRLLLGGQGLAYVDDATPQLGIALEPQYQRRGFGRPLMQAALAAAWENSFRQVSLTVHPENPAISMYKACGFCKQGQRGTYHPMLAKSAT
ncbi:MAG: GNAT family N-acetyltransferase [Rhodocyclaceae bacterium]|nr:GNAT family N-acetyltransferase [Rhodocyclaceae bacterium]